MQKLVFLLILFAFCKNSYCQQGINDSLPAANVSITYNVSITAKNKRSIAETYNGAVKTVYAAHNKVRLRFVSLMRSQSIYYNHKADTNSTAVVAIESGAKRYKFRLSASSWNAYNKKYEGAVTTFENDSIQLLGHWCKKAIITLADQTKLSVWYFPAIRNDAFIAAEPMFAGIPGIPMQYEFHDGKKMIVYTAKEISFDNIAASIFQPPVKGYAVRKFAPGKAVKDNLEEEEE